MIIFSIRYCPNGDKSIGYQIVKAAEDALAKLTK
jgi:hypothetical protein